MRREYRWAVASIIALTIGVFAANGYARTAIPFYRVVANALTAGHPWKVETVRIRQSDAGPAMELQLVGEVRNRITDPEPAALILSRAQLGSITQNAVVFWLLLLLVPPVSIRQLLLYLAVGLPMFALLESITTVCQLVGPMAYATAVLAGEPDPLTLWERWSRFLQAGGLIVIDICAGLLTVSIARAGFNTR